MDKSRLLIIDDQPDSIGLLLSYLEGQVRDILVALDGADGLAKASKGRPELILLDIQMPGMDGFAVCEHLKADAQTGDIPVIFLSGRDALDDKLHGFALGAVDYITKPFSEAEVLARVGVHLQSRFQTPSLKNTPAARILEELPDPRRNDERLFNRAVALLENQLDDPPSLIEMVRQLGTNQRKLTDLFRQRVGMTVFDYFTELRLETARSLLELSDTHIQLISDRVGYSNPGDFTRAFRRRYGVSPSEYRQARR